jgi:uncharacterized cupin superfamily protein
VLAPSTKEQLVQKSNVNRAEFDEPRDHDGFRAKRARIGYALGAERLGVSLWEVPPGEVACPYHYHLAEEELFVVLSGRPSLRTPDGWSELESGDIISFSRGEAGAHQLVNRTGDPVRFIALSTNGEPDIVIYPDSGKLGAVERLPHGGGLRTFFRLADQIDYWDGEEPKNSGDVRERHAEHVVQHEREPLGGSQRVE